MKLLHYAVPKALLPVALLLLRVGLGLYMLLAGIAKVRGELNVGLGTFYNGPFSGLKPGWLPDAIAAPYGYALPWLEVVFGALLLIGLFGAVAALINGLMILSFTIALALKLGVTAAPADAAGPFSANYILLAACFVLAITGPGALSVDGVLFRRKTKRSDD